MKIAFFTASRADYGKIKPLILQAKKNELNSQYLQLVHIYLKNMEVL